MPETNQAIEEVLIDPLEKLLFAVGRGIAVAQMELDRYSIAAQTMIDNNEQLSQAGVEAPWYHFPETTVDLRMTLSIRWEEQKRDGKTVAWKRVVYAAPVNAAYKNQFDFDVSGSSNLRARIVSVPPRTGMGSEG